MNISSILISAASAAAARELGERIDATEHCTVEFIQGEKIIALIECTDLNEELAAYKRLEGLAGVVSINMVFSSQDLGEEGAQNSLALKRLEGEGVLEYYGGIFRRFS